MRRSYIRGLGTFVPERIVTNDELSKKMDTSDEWIQQRTGIKERHYADEGVFTSDLGAEAAKSALADAKMGLEEIDFTIFATLSPDFHFPGSGCYMQKKLGNIGVGALDIRNQCSGFIYGLAIADAFVRLGMYKNVLLVGAEVHSSALNYTREGRHVAVLFGDAAGAVIVSAAPEGSESGIFSTHLHADGTQADLLHLEIFNISKKPYITHEDIDAGRIWPQMNGRAVFREATTRMKEVILECLEANGRKIEDIDLFVPHQANLRINQWVASEFGLPDEKVVNNIQKYGNTTAASIPLALLEARQDGRLKRGSLICLASFGAGFTWASALIRW